MKKITLVFLFLLMYQFLFAGEKIDRKGNKAIQFSFNSTSFINGGKLGIGGKVWVKNNLALRTSLLFDDQSTKMVFPTENLADRIIDSTKIKISIELENHFESLKKLSPYIGGIVGLQIEKFYQKDQIPLNPNSGESNRQNYFIGLLLGVEYWITDHISLSGSHYINIMYSHYKEEENYLRKIKRETTSTIINSSTSSLIISVYF